MLGLGVSIWQRFVAVVVGTPTGNGTLDFSDPNNSGLVALISDDF
jgi:hypothetical protein